MAHRQPELLDIDVIVKDKAEDKYKYFPRFVINYLKGITHEDEVDECLTRYPNATGCLHKRYCI